jgi:hypothetical protein
MAMQSGFEAGELVRSDSIELENTLPLEDPTRDARRIFLENEREMRKEEEEDAQWHSYYQPWEPTDGNV